LKSWPQENLGLAGSGRRLDSWQALGCFCMGQWWGWFQPPLPKFHNIVTYMDYVSQVENLRIFPIIKSLNQTLILQKWSEGFIGTQALFPFMTINL
jgi:hypothetical protein